MQGEKHKIANEILTDLLYKYFYQKHDTEIAEIFVTDYKARLKVKGNAESYRKILSRLRQLHKLPTYDDIEKTFRKNIEEELRFNLVDILQQKNKDKEKIISVLSQKKISVEQLAAKIKKPFDYVRFIIDELKNERYNIVERDGFIGISKDAEVGGYRRIDLSKFENKIYRLGFTSDNHLNSIFERLDVLHALYDLFEKEGITEVYNAGNWIDGEASFNRYELKNHGATKQIEYFVNMYPQRKGITTYFIAGDDHEGWYFKDRGINIGEYAQMKAEQKGRHDLVYLGYVEADVDLVAKEGKAKMRIMHPGGGSAYAVSYSPQKMIESFQGGEKPNILALGHFHKADYMFYRDVHALQLGTTQDQSTFMRKKKIQASLGGWIVEFQQSKDGAIHRFKPEWITFFNKEYYERKKYYE